jgi:hypothetical protein
MTILCIIFLDNARLWCYYLNVEKLITEAVSLWNDAGEPMIEQEIALSGAKYLVQKIQG